MVEDGGPWVEASSEIASYGGELLPQTLPLLLPLRLPRLLTLLLTRQKSEPPAFAWV